MRPPNDRATNPHTDLTPAPARNSLRFWVSGAGVAVGALLCLVTGLAGRGQQCMTTYDRVWLTVWPWWAQCCYTHTFGSRSVKRCVTKQTFTHAGYLSFRGLVQGEILDSFPSSDVPAAYVLPVRKANVHKSVHNSVRLYRVPSSSPHTTGQSILTLATSPSHTECSGSCW